MKKLWKKSGLALGTLTAAAALLSGLSVADAQTAPGGGSFPGSFLVPGTNTSLKIGGYTKLDVIYDLGPISGDTTDPNAVPLNGTLGAKQLHGTFRMHAKESRFNFETRTPTGYGELKTFLEVDFFGNELANIAGSTNGLAANPLYPRLRHAYGTLGPLLIGQSFSLFSDIDAIGETLDGGGPTGYMSATSGNRIPQIRYTYAGPGGISLAADIEQPLTRWISAGAGTTGSGNSLQGINGSIATAFAGNTNATNKIPSFVAAARWDQGWGHLMFKGVTTDNRIYLGPSGATPTINLNKRGWGVSVSGHLNTFGKDVLRANAQIGRGMGIYNYGTEAESIIWNGAIGGAAALTQPGSLDGLVSYQHWWTDELRTNIVEAYDIVQRGGAFSAAVAAGTERRHWTSHVNLIWSPVPQVDLGLEYAFLQRVVQSGAHGTENRLQVAGKFKF